MTRIDAGKTYDVAIVGAGVVGCAIARHLAQFKVTCALLDAAADVGTGTSKANTAILHTGFDAKPGLLENTLVRRGYQLLSAYAPQAGIPFERTGALLVAWDEEQVQALPHIQALASENGIDDGVLVPREVLMQLEPHLGSDAKAALLIPGESIICPFTTTLAFATEAFQNGVEVRLNHRVTGIVSREGIHTLLCEPGPVHCRHLVNSAGLHSDRINAMLGHDEFDIIPRRGELIVYDKFARRLVNHILLPVPGKMGKGVLIAPTVFGNVLLGPTAEDLEDRTASETTPAGLAALLREGAKRLPALASEEVTATYAGLRAATRNPDYQIHFHPNQRYICAGGIRSTGLTASMAIAEHVVEGMREAGLFLRPKARLQPIRMPSIGEAQERPYQNDGLIRSDPAYGEIICHCEKVTHGEIRDALEAPLPARDLDGLRRRSRALLGRCQGFYCQAALLQALDRSSESGQRPLRRAAV